MIEAIISASLKDRFMVILAALIITLVGLFAYKNTPLDAIPDLSDVQVILFLVCHLFILFLKIIPTCTGQGRGY